MKAAATLLLFLTLAVPPPLVNSQSLISSSLSSTVTHIAVSTNGVFVSTANQVHRFSSTLQQLEGSPDTPGGAIDGLASTPDGEWCIVCTDAGGITCSVLNGSNLEAPANRTEVLNNGTASSLVVFTGGNGNSFYTGSIVNNRILYHQYGFAVSTVERAANSVDQVSSNFDRRFVSGFFALGYAYYVTNDPPTSGTSRRLRIIRVCNDSAGDGFNNQYELTLGCDGNNGFFNPTLIGISVINGETLLIAIRTESVDDVCSYSLSEINSLMDAAYQSCVVDGTGTKNIFWQSSAICSGGLPGLNGTICSISDSRIGTPAPAVGVSNPLTSTGLVTNSTILTGLTAIVGVSIDNIDFIYFAFTINSNNYYINKYRLVNSTTLTFISEVTPTFSVTSLSWSQGSEYVYGRSGSNVIALKIEDCSSATSCSECVSLGDPLCGRCMIENKCSRRPFCQDNDQTRRYLTQGDSSYCFDAVSINPSTYVIDTEQQPHQVNLTFSPAPPPPTLPGEGYFCVFNGIMSPLELSMGTNTGSCSVQGIVSQVNGIQLGSSNAVSQYQLQNDTLSTCLVLSDGSLLIGTASHIIKLNSDSLTVNSSLPLNTTTNQLLLLLNDTGFSQNVLSCQEQECFLLNPNDLCVTVNVSTSPFPSSFLFPTTPDMPGLYTEGRNFFVGKDADSPVASSISKLRYSFSGSQLQITLVGSQRERNINLARKFLANFQQNGFIYYVFVLSGFGYKLQIARICSNDTGIEEDNVLVLTTYTEAELQCNEMTDPDSITAATFVQYNGESMIMVSMRSGSTNIICAFNVSEINTRMDDKLSSCKNGLGTLSLKRNGGSVSCPTDLEQSQKNVITVCHRQGVFISSFEVDSPTFGVKVAFTSQVSSLNSLAYEDTVYLYAGSHQTIEQYYFTTDNLLIPIRNIATTTTEQVNKIEFSPDGEYLYAFSATHITNGGSASNLCPFLEPNSVTFDGRYTQAANVVKDLTLSTSNTGSSPGLTYECVYGTDTRTATVSSDNRVTCINNPGLTIGGGGGTQTVSLSLRQVYNGNTYTIETNATANLNVILYNCPSLALGCSSCLAQRIGTGFNCSWCNNNTQCRDISDCSDASPVISTGNCPLPIITDFNPKTGPPRGGTTIFIDGTNLGTQRSDIESVMIGSRNCTFDEYQPGKRIRCTIVPDASDNMDRNETIRIRVIRSGGNETANSTAQFQFLTPVIRSVSPTFGPVSGGTRIRVQGTNFDIGNKEMIRVILRESSSRKKRNTCPDVNCNIVSITNTEINCDTGSNNDTNCMRNVIVSVDGASFSNTSISYQYRPDPRFDSISPMITIPVGGIQLVFTGANLNSVQSPTITINDSRLIPSSVEPCITNGTGTMLICNAPNITNVVDSSYYGTSIEYMLMLNGAESPNYMNAGLRLTLQRNPIFTGIDADSRSILVDDVNDITILGMNVESVSSAEINITLGDIINICTVRTTSNTEITCRPPNKPSGTTLALRVRVGRNLVFPSNAAPPPLINSQSLISSSLSSTVTHIAVSTNGVFVSTASQVHRFSSTLQQLEGSPDTPGGAIDGIASTPDGEWCIVCTDAGGVTCSVLNGSNLEAPANRTVTNSGTASSLVAFTGGDCNSFYTGSTVNQRILYHQYGFAGSTVERATNAGHQLSSNFDRAFLSGFFASGYAYYVVNDPPTSGSSNRRLRIIRVFINGETLLIAIRSGLVDDVCSYNLSEINSLMDAAYQSCVVDGLSSVSCAGGSPGLDGTICSISDSRSASPAPAVGVANPLTPTGLVTNTTILNGLTAIVGVSIDDIDFIYFAFTLNSNNYYINKYHLVNSTTLTFISEVTSTSSVTSLSWSQGSEYVYGISGTNVIALKTEDCSSATSCSECVSLGDPLCGWCMIESKCSRRPFCQDNDQTRRYLTQGDSNNCFDTVSINPPTYITDTEQQPHQVNLTFSPASPPLILPGEGYFCVFNGIMSPLELSMGTNTGSCSVQDIVSQVTGIQLDTTFSIYSNRTNVNFYTRPANYTFYNCPTALKCSACLQSETCGWCQLDFTCTGQNSSCTTGEWFNTKDGGRASSFCPFLEPNSVTSDGRYTQAANVVKDLTLSTSNTGSSPGLTYECVYGTDTRTATVSSDNRVTCINIPMLFIGGGSTQNVLLSLRQVYNGNRYTIETNATANLNVILYDCPSLALGCSSCLAQRIGTGFSCSWCTSNSQCRDISDCNDASPVISTGSCLPNIMDFNPKAGPPRGGTTIFINGTNLGTQRTDIESVMIGSRNCTVDEYQAGVRIRCTIVPDASDNIDRNETIRIRVIRSSGNETAISTAQFQFLTPIIQSVSPTFGPVSGGTRIRVQGTNFDIGNKEMTRVILRESSSRKKRNICPDVNCNIMSIINTEINCVTGSINDTDCVRNVIVSVDGASFSNTSIGYEYRPDPTFDSISPMITIPVGGIQLVFTGTNLNSVESPTITINDSRLIYSSTEPCIANDTGTLLSCTAPDLIYFETDSSYFGTRLEYMLMLDGAESPNYTNTDLSLTLQPNPIFTGIDNDSRSIPVDDINDITIMGMNILSVDPSEINIILGDNDTDRCSNVRTTSNTEITCRPPIKPSGTRLALRIQVARLYYPFSALNGSQWTLVYTDASTIITTITTTTGTTSTSAPSSILILAIVGGAIAASVITLLIIAIPLIIVIFIGRKRAKDKSIPHEGNAVVPMSMNMIYQGSTNQHNILLHQSNPAYTKASDIHIYDEIPANQYEEFVFVNKTNNDGDDEEDQDNEDHEGYVDTGVINGVAQSSEDKEDQNNEDNEGYVDTGVIDGVAQSSEDKEDQDNEDNEGYVDTGVIDGVAQSSEDKGSYENILKVDDDDYI
uniref:Sema domain-containing protein n=1 Tax=Amphimedon queenslandica TaxID=400682 RepID=A0A1X7URZ8_AMPQE